MKKAMGRTYLELLDGFDLIQLPLLKTSYAENIFWVFGILLKDIVNLGADEMINRLKLQGIGSREFFGPFTNNQFSKMRVFILTKMTFLFHPRLLGVDYTYHPGLA